MLQTIKRYCKTTDLPLLGLCIFLSGLSVLTLVSVGLHGGLDYGGTLGNAKPAVTQVLALAVGLIGAFVMSAVDYQYLLRYWPVHAAFCWFLVLLTFVPGIGYSPGETGSQSWISLPFGMSFQPTEIAKVSFFITMALHLDTVHDKLNRISTLGPVLLHMLGPALLVHLQGDDGTALVFLAVGVLMLLMAGLSRWVVAGIVAAVAAAVPLAWQFLLGEYQKQRILGLFNPQAYADTIMYQQIRGAAAIRRGGLTGQGFFSPNHTYIPEAENDFIFSYFAEACGFLGVLLLLALLFGILFCVLRVAALARSRAGAYLCVGVFGALLFQVAVNVAMNLGIFPVMGLTLPYLSAGGTSLLMSFLSIGIVLNVDHERKKDALVRAGKITEVR